MAYESYIDHQPEKIALCDYKKSHAAGVYCMSGEYVDLVILSTVRFGLYRHWRMMKMTTRRKTY